MEVIFTAKLDKQYPVRVIRTGDRTGRLEVYQDDEATEPLRTWDVSLGYGAIFGPDVLDVEEWHGIVAEYIDGRNL